MNETPSRLLELLKSQHTFPTRYVHKVIGKNSPEFLAGVKDLIDSTVRLSEKTKKETASGSHVSVTLELQAIAAEEVVFLIEKSNTLKDVVYVL